jgi:hypothetical protein
MGSLYTPVRILFAVKLAPRIAHLPIRLFAAFVGGIGAMMLGPSAQAADSWCQVTCTAGASGTFYDSGDVSLAGGYTYPFSQQAWDDSEEYCQNYLDNLNITSIAQSRGICGTVTCTGYYHLGARPRRGPLSRTASVECSGGPNTGGPTSSGPHASCCPPGTGNDISSLFHAAQPTPSSDYTMTYNPSANNDNILQMYLNYVAAVNSSIATMDAYYDIFDLTANVWISPGAVTYVPGGTSPLPYGPFFLVPHPQYSPNAHPLQVNHNYKICRQIRLLDKNGNRVSYYDPNCKDRCFEYEIRYKAYKSARPGEPTGESVAIIKVEGQPDRQVEIRRGSGATPSRKLPEAGTDSRIYKPGEASPTDDDAGSLNQDEVNRFEADTNE